MSVRESKRKETEMTAMFSQDVLVSKVLLTRIDMSVNGDVVKIVVRTFSPDVNGDVLINGVKSIMVGSMNGQADMIDGKMTGIIPRIMLPEVGQVINNGLVFLGVGRPSAKKAAGK